MPLDFLGASQQGYQMGRQTGQDFMQIQQMAKQQKQQQATDNAMGNYMANPSRESLMNLANVNPEAAQNMMMQQQKRSEDEGRFVLSAYHTIKSAPPSRKNEIYREMKKQADIAGMNTSEFGDEYSEEEMLKLEDMARVASGRYGEQEAEPMSPMGKLTADFRSGKMDEATYQAMVKKLTSLGKSQVSISMGVQQTEEQKAIGKYRGEKVGIVQDSAEKAVSDNQAAAAFEAALRDPEAYTGFGAKTVTNLKRAASSLGMDVKGLSSEAVIQSIGNKLALRLRNPKGDEGLTGSTSDPDREFLVSSVPGIVKTKEQNFALIEVDKILNNRKIEIARMQEDYLERRGTTVGFNKVRDEFVKNNPLFSGSKGEELKRRLRGEGGGYGEGGTYTPLRENSNEDILGNL